MKLRQSERSGRSCGELVLYFSYLGFSSALLAAAVDRHDLAVQHPLARGGVRIRRESLRSQRAKSRLILFPHLLAMMRRIADQPLPDRIDDKVENLQRNLANEWGAIVGHFGNFNVAFAALNYQATLE